MCTQNLCIRIGLALSLAAPFAPPCLEALGLIGPRKKGEKTGFERQLGQIQPPPSLSLRVSNFYFSFMLLVIHNKRQTF
jgi:hypothetical protein